MSDASNYATQKPDVAAIRNTPVSPAKSQLSSHTAAAQSETITTTLWFKKK